MVLCEGSSLCLTSLELEAHKEAVQIQPSPSRYMGVWIRWTGTVEWNGIGGWVMRL